MEAHRWSIGAIWLQVIKRLTIRKGKPRVEKERGGDGSVWEVLGFSDKFF